MHNSEYYYAGFRHVANKMRKRNPRGKADDNWQIAAHFKYSNFPPPVAAIKCVLSYFLAQNPPNKSNYTTTKVVHGVK